MADRNDDFRSELVALLPRLRRFALALTRSRDDAEDLVQSAFQRALEREDQWRAGTRLDSWTYRIVQNLWIDQTRSRKARGEHTDLDALDRLAGEDGRATIERRLTLKAAWTAFQVLSPEIRATASLVIVNGASYQEAAETLDIPIGTVMSRVARARKAMEAALNAEPAGTAAQ